MTWLETLSEIALHSAGMAWEIAWPLVLGFAISGFVQAFVPRRRIAGALGSLGPRPLALATGLGMASSSCSYAAAAMSKTLVQKGAHFVNATAFLFASTNLVLEMGLVIWMLMGWHFVAAEFAGGVVLILVAAVLLRWLAPRPVFERAREHLEHAPTAHEHEHSGGTLPWSKLLTREGVAAAGSYYVTDWRMIWRDIALGLVLAGILAVLVPEAWWETLFLASGGAEPSFWIKVENAIVGPVIAILAFVCSIGNIPLAAVLWQGGISFGGVIAFIYADLVTIPMVLVYRRYYGWKPALVYSGYLLATMIIAGLVIEGLFEIAGLVPDEASRASVGQQDFFTWNYTTVLNLVFLPLGAALGWMGARHRR